MQSSQGRRPSCHLTQLPLFQVKCSDNDVYRVQPVDGVAKARGSTRIEVLRQNGAAKPDKLVVVVAGPAGETLMAVVDLLVVEDEDEE